MAKYNGQNAFKISRAMLHHAEEILIAAEKDGVPYALSDDETLGFSPGQVATYLRSAWKLKDQSPQSEAQWETLAAAAIRAITAVRELRIEQLELF